MFRTLFADKDAYINNRVIQGSRAYNANTGQAGTLDLFKLYGYTLSGTSPNVELSRLLVHFDLSSLRELVNQNRININHPSFNVKLKLFDVYGGQPTPDNFTVNVYPLSRSFDEGHGRDVVMYADFDSCNFITASRAGGVWGMQGCDLGGFATDPVDYITSASVGGNPTALKSSQLFVKGDEDLVVDVTDAIKATLTGSIPDAGFRISLDPSHESDSYTYFVKRFAARGAYNTALRPVMYVRFDDSIQDDTLALSFDASGSLFLYNYVANKPAPLMSGSSVVTGSGCLTLRLITEISGGVYQAVFTGSQHTMGSSPVVGLYSASVYLSSQEQVLASKLALSSSIEFTPVWTSLDGTVAYLTGSTVFARRPARGNVNLAPKKYVVNVVGLNKSYRLGDGEQTLRINVFDNSDPFVKFVKTPIETPSVVLHDTHFSVRDAVSNVVLIPFDRTYNSTRASSDGTGGYFSLDVDSLPVGSYVIDISLDVGGHTQLYPNASAVFVVAQT